MTKKTKKNISIAKEPSVTYVKNRITVFTSLEEQENENYKWLASLSPEENLYHATELIKRVFADELKQHPTTGNRIKFND